MLVVAFILTILFSICMIVVSLHKICGLVMEIINTVEDTERTDIIDNFTFNEQLNNII